MTGRLNPAAFLEQVNICLQTQPSQEWIGQVCALLGECTHSNVLLSDVNDVMISRWQSLDDINVSCMPDSYMASITMPLHINDKQAGILKLYRFCDEYDESERLAASVAFSVLTVAMFYYATQVETERHRRVKAVKAVLNTLTFSELETVIRIFHKLDGGEGLLVAGRVADELGMTRSVVVNALRKLEGTGMVETRSLGMKGTYIRILNPLLWDEIKKLKH